jgi:phospholipid-binding lipoprotein MlaA
MPARIPALLIALLLSGCATTQQTAPSPRDPFERMNRGVYRFNDTMDRAFLKPAAKGYRAVVPPVARKGIGNALSNLAYTTTLVNNILQLKPGRAMEDLTRLIVNTTIGVAGLWDPATKMGIPRNDEDFGQTLGRWGVPSGPFIMLPFFGPSSVRDTPGLAVDMFTDGSHYIEEDKVRYSLLGLEILDLRVSLFPLDETLAGTYDPYAFIRNAYLQRREYLVKDGAIEEEPLEDPEFEDPEPEDPAAGPAPDAARVDQHSEQTAMAVAAPEGAT